MICSIAAPLRVWLLVAAIAGPLFLAAFLIAPPDQTAVVNRRLDTLLSRLRRERDVQVKSVLFVGNSLLEAALGKPSESFAAINAARNGAALQIQRAIVSGSSMVLLKPLFQRLLELRPNLLVIEADMLFSTPRRRSNASLWAQQLRRLGRDRVIALLGTETLLPVVDGPRRVRAMRLEYRLEQMPHWHGRTASVVDPSYVATDEFLRLARASGIECALLVLPISRKLQQGVEAFAAVRNRLLAELAERHGVRLLWLTDFTSDHHFYDQRHMNVAGRSWFRQRIVPELTRVLAAILPK